MCVWCVENQGHSEVIERSKSELLPETSQTQIRFDFKLSFGRAFYCPKFDPCNPHSGKERKQFLQIVL